MKKTICLFFCVVVLFATAVNVNAVKYKYEDLYAVKLPDDFEEVYEHKYVGDDSSAFYVTIEENPNGEYCIENLSEEKLRENAEAFASKAAEGFAAVELKGKSEVVSVEKIKHPNGMTAVVTVYETSVEKDGETISNLQKAYEFSGAENKYTFTYTGDKPENVDDLDSAFDSIYIFEGEAESYFDKALMIVVFAFLVFLVLLGIFKFIRGRKK